MPAGPDDNRPAAAAADGAPRFDRIREFYLYQEPALLAAIRSGDRRTAVGVLNRVLTPIYSLGMRDGELLKGLLLELVVMISRAAVEAGASQTEILGMRFSHLTELAELDDEEDIAAWLRHTLERIFEVMERQPQDRPGLVAASLEYLRANLRRDITRRDLARHVGVSPGHLSWLLKERTGRPFVEILRDVRVQAAAEMLEQTDSPLADIAAQCGFCDQSYMTHVFRELRGMTPGRFREQARGAPAAG